MYNVGIVDITNERTVIKYKYRDIYVYNLIVNS